MINNQQLLEVISTAKKLCDQYMVEDMGYAQIINAAFALHDIAPVSWKDRHAVLFSIMDDDEGGWCE